MPVLHRRLRALIVSLLAAGTVPALAADSPWQLRVGLSSIVADSDPGRITPGKITINSDTGPSLNLNYFFTPNLALDVLGGLPFKHTLKLDGSAVGRTRHLPPIVSLQWHLAPQAPVRPYLGLGVNYTYFFDEKLDDGSRLALSDSWGLAGQIGVDLSLNERWQIGADVRYARIASDVKINGDKVGKVDIDPFVYSLTLAHRF